uniref:Uncharacterized protein n=1 Tax=Myoviridae sp. ctY1522 TaxID=2825124 RepID=A0A8S5TQV3_9CAUD|nr:MAG TPA: hypothetical protein [Myoviridae sp. ctY1522]
MGRPKKSVCESCRYVMTASSESHCGYMLITGMVRGAHSKEFCPKWEKRTRENYRGHFRLDPKMVQESRIQDMQAERRRSVQHFDEQTKGAKKNG